MTGDRSAVPIPVILSIDVEPDEFLVDINNPRPWTGFEFCQDYMNGFRKRLEDNTDSPVHFNWALRMDPQIGIAYGDQGWVADKYRSLIEDFRSRGDQISLHVHNYRWSRSLDGWIDDIADSDWVAECLETSVNTYRQSFGQTCRVMSFGNYWQSTETVNLAEKLGIRYDLTLEPGTLSKLHYGNRPQSAPTPSFCRVPRVPYHPSSADYRVPATNEERDITLIPLSSSYLKLGYGVRDLRARVGRLLRNGPSGRLQSTRLSLVHPWEGDNTFSAMLDRAISVQKQPYLALTFRSNINRQRLPRVESSLNALLSNAASPRFRFLTPAEAMAHREAVWCGSPVIA